MFEALKDIAPTLASALVNPVGTFAGIALKTIGSALGLSDATKETIAQALQGITPEQKLALQQEDHNFQLALQTAYINQMQIKENAAKDALDDEANARQMQGNAINKVRIELIRWFGVLTIFVWGFTFFLYMKQAVQGDEGYMIGTLNAGIVAIWSMIIGFYFGTGIDKVMGFFNNKEKS